MDGTTNKIDTAAINESLRAMDDENRIQVIQEILDGICPQCGAMKSPDGTCLRTPRPHHEPEAGLQGIITIGWFKMPVMECEMEMEMQWVHPGHLVGTPFEIPGAHIDQNRMRYEGKN